MELGFSGGDEMFWNYSGDAHTTPTTVKTTGSYA